MLSNIKNSLDVFGGNILVLDNIEMKRFMSVQDILTGIVKNLNDSYFLNKFPATIIMDSSSPFIMLFESLLSVLSKVDVNDCLTIILSFPYGELVSFSVFTLLAEQLILMTNEVSGQGKVKWVMLMNCGNSMQYSLYSVPNALCSGQIAVNLVFPGLGREDRYGGSSARALYNDYLTSILPQLPIILPGEVLLDIHEAFNRLIPCVYSTVVCRY